MTILVHIQNKYATFTDKEKAIASFILSETRLVRNMTITELAHRTETSGATITRFCKKISCENFVDLKMKIHMIYKEIEPVESVTTHSNVYHYYSEVIGRTKELINLDKIYQVVNWIKQVDKIYIYGIGSSGLSALELMQRLLRMGLNVHAVSDSHMMIINSSIVTSKDLVIGISISGETKEVIKSLKNCKQNDVKTVSITCFEGSSIANYSDLILPVYNTSFINNKRFINSQFSTMYLLDLISTLLLEDEGLNAKYQLTVDAIQKS